MLTIKFYKNVNIDKDINDEIEIYEFALNMGVKGYIIGTRSKDTNPKEADYQLGLQICSEV